MKPRMSSFLALALGIFTILGTQMLAYGLVYPSGAHHTKLPIFCALLGGALSASSATALALRSHRLAGNDSERFFALLAWATTAFFLFVVVLGFGIPALVLGTHD